MTQASLPASPDPTLGIRASEDTPDARLALGSEASLWLFGLTSSTLVLASLLLLGLLVQSAALDTSPGGFVAATALIAVALGVAATAYVLATARRTGYLQAFGEPRPVPAADSSSGLQVAPIVPADLGSRKRQELVDDRAGRSKQAKAIAVAESIRRSPRPTAPRPGRVRPLTTPARPAGVSARMPRPAAQRVRLAPRPSATPSSLRISPPPVHARAQPALFQVSAAIVRTPFGRPAPRPPARAGVATRP